MSQSSAETQILDPVTTIETTHLLPNDKLKAHNYQVDDIDATAESLSGSGNLNYLSLQSQLTDDAYAGLAEGLIDRDALNIATQNNPLSFRLADPMTGFENAQNNIADQDGAASIFDNLSAFGGDITSNFANPTANPTINDMMNAPDGLSNNGQSGGGLRGVGGGGGADNNFNIDNQTIENILNENITNENIVNETIVNNHHNVDIVENVENIIELTETILHETINTATNIIHETVNTVTNILEQVLSDFGRFSGDSEQSQQSTIPIDQVAEQQNIFNTMIAARRTERDVITEQIKQKRQQITVLQAQKNTAQNNLSIVTKLYQSRRQLSDQGVLSEAHAMETLRQKNDLSGEVKQLTGQIAMARNAIREFENRLSSLNAQHKDDAYQRLDIIRTERYQNSELVRKLEQTVNRLDIRSPVTGIVKHLHINTVGAVIQPGGKLVEILPLDQRFIAQIKIPPKHIGHVHLGQNVQLKFSAYDFSRYGFVSGQLSYISPTTFTGEQGERYYQGHVDLGQSYIGRHENLKILPGMTVMADILTGRKTILDYLLRPIHITLKTALRER